MGYSDFVDLQDKTKHVDSLMILEKEMNILDILPIYARIFMDEYLIQLKFAHNHKKHKEFSLILDFDFDHFWNCFLISTTFLIPSAVWKIVENCFEKGLGI